jgi:hypothetical protein
MKKKSFTLAILTTVFILVALFSALSGSAQKIKQDATGNYYASKELHSDSIAVIETGHTFTNRNGDTFKLYRGKRGGIFYYTQDKYGKLRKQYIHID